MKLFIPRSIFAGIAIYNLDENTLSDVESRPAASIVNELIEGKCDAAIIPSFDLLRHNDLFVSKKTCVAFDGALCNSFLYFQRNKIKIDELFLSGDVTSNEVFLTKFLFEEMYDSEVKITLDTKKPDFEKKNYLLVGNSNFDNDQFRKGISFAEQLAEFFDFPYVNFLLASKSEEVIKGFNSQFENVDENIEKELNVILSKLSLTEESKNYIRSHFNQVYFEMTDNEREGLTEMLKFPYYKGILEDMIEIKFV